MSRRRWSRTIRYATVWEDARVLCRALAPVSAGQRLLSVASAGDNVLALLTLDPAEVIAVDYNPAQLACLELRIAAFRRLAHPEVLGFLGAVPERHRLATYEGLRRDLSPESRELWDARPRDIARGILHAGRLEGYVRMFRQGMLPLVHSSATARRLLEPRAGEERKQFYDQVWNTRRWRFLFRIFFSRSVMTRLGRDPEFFAHAESSPADHLLARTRSALVDRPTHENPYLAYVVTGGYPEACRPDYLRQENFAAIRDRLDRIRVVRSELREYLQAEPRTFSGFNLSDVFEYLAPPDHEALYELVLRRAEPGARLVYWNMLVPRSMPPRFVHRSRPLRELATELQGEDRVWFYRAFHIDEATTLDAAAPAQPPGSGCLAGSGV